MSIARFWPVSTAAIVLIAAALGIAAIYATDAAGGGAKGNGASLERTEKSVAFREDMRKLWEDHIVWTRAFIVSFAADAGDQDEVSTRLLANQDHIGDAIKPFYGEAAGEQLSALLKEHILGAVTLLQAAKAGRFGNVRRRQGRVVCERQRDRAVPECSEPGELAARPHVTPHDDAPELDAAGGCQQVGRELRG